MWISLTLDYIKHAAIHPYYSLLVYYKKYPIVQYLTRLAMFGSGPSLEHRPVVGFKILLHMHLLKYSFSST